MDGWKDGKIEINTDKQTEIDWFVCRYIGRGRERLIENSKNIE